jgi:hypothetical protein
VQDGPHGAPANPQPPIWGLVWQIGGTQILGALEPGVRPEQVEPLAHSLLEVQPTSPSAQLPAQVPPQPSPWPHVLPEQLGTHAQVPEELQAKPVLHWAFVEQEPPELHGHRAEQPGMEWQKSSENGR